MYKKTLFQRYWNAEDFFVNISIIINLPLISHFNGKVM